MPINIIDGFQSSTRQTDFATRAKGEEGGAVQAVSILYEADRLCNRPTALGSRGLASRFNPLRGRQTLQHGGVPQEVRYLLRVSILYEADRLCNSGSPGTPNPPGRHVSILYEADRLCNVGSSPVSAAPGIVSILYEADRLCNCHT